VGITDDVYVFAPDDVQSGVLFVFEQSTTTDIGSRAASYLEYAVIAWVVQCLKERVSHTLLDLSECRYRSIASLPLT
jgi:hypothetical protein